VDELRFAGVARALSNPARVRILTLLAGQPECAGADLFAELPLAQSTVSEHLRVLREADLITSHAVGTSMVYCIVAPTLAAFREALGALEDPPTCSDVSSNSALPRSLPRKAHR